MAEKQQPLGICDLCLGPIREQDWYTSKGKPRLHCSIDCRQTANSRIGAPIRSRKAKERVTCGEWFNPRSRMTPEEISAVQSRISRNGRLREVAEGRWRNPALTQEARLKLSQPRKHSGVLHTALEKLSTGQSVSDLTEAEQIAHRQYRQQLRQKRHEEINRQARQYYHRKQAAMTPEAREAQKERWRQANRRRKLRQAE